MALLPINTSSYDGFRADAMARAAQGLGYDVDGYIGYQCWDLAAELWMNLPEFAGQGLYPQTGPNLYASECWTYSRTVNAGNSFDLIYNLSDVKRGDVVVLDLFTTGHIAFADADYTGAGYLYLLGQNQVNPDPYAGHIPTITYFNMSTFLGAFRYKEWIGPTPPVSVSEHHFPWFLTANKRRGYL